jgi:hypothetical protein
METTDTLVRGELEIVGGDLDQRVTVLIHHPKMPQSSEVTYGCKFEVAVGDAVLCPPSPLWPEPFTGIVTALTGGTYSGPIKYLIRRM